MTNKEDSIHSEITFEGGDPLQQQFQEKLKELIHPQLSKELILRDYAYLVIGFLGILAGCFGTYISLATSRLTGPANLILMSVSLFTTIMLSFSLYFVIRELKSGQVNTKKFDEIGLLLSAGFVFIFFFFYFVFARKNGLSTEDLIYFGTGLLFFWILAMTAVLWQNSQWNKEEILLEQKRTQLEIAQLREELAQRFSTTQ